ncbi:enoyl-CoA hydratase/isomerase family protein [Tardiphaga sp. 215_C5_N2_1]|uniref:enoyl-CoA hydratase/isomerase family protein n=1 Tax=Tardiphaga sp. 215_C5_N2_1 TaxID=3240774 RepID=UPI003F8C01A8
MTDIVLLERRGRTAHLILNRPEKLNSLNVALFEALDAHVKEIAADPSRVAAVVLRGAGKCFSAGHDLSDIAAGEKPPEPNYQSKVIERISRLPLPVVTAVHGHCFTGALELALSGDLILAAENARFADTHAKWALTPIWGLSQRLPRRVGTSKAREMMYTCRTYSGRAAEAMGLVNACFPDDEFETGIESWVDEIASNSSFSHAANKRLLDSTDGLPLPAGLAHEVFRSEGKGPDMADRIAAFASRKKS